MFTNWMRAGDLGVRYAMNYASLHSVLVMRAVPKKHWPDLFDDLRVMEDAALEHLAKQK